MKKTKRLFLFAGYDKDNIIDDTVVYYVNALSKLGDVIFVADNDLSDQEMKKISQIPNVLYVGAGRHGEYDFGSYKRGYFWAKEKKILKNYDWMYFVNDSVYGPLYDLSLTLSNLEQSGAGFVGMAANRDKYTPLHIQSWFVGFNKDILTSDFLSDFMGKIKHMPNKMYLCLKYEAGLSNLITRHGFDIKVIVNPEHNTIYEDPRPCLTLGIPFVKKTSAANLCDMCFLYPYAEDEKLLDYISAHMQRHGVAMAKDTYRTIYELRLFGIRLLRIMSKDSKYYKVYLFAKIPVLKIIK